MASYLETFMEYFGFLDILTLEQITVQHVLALTILAFIGCIITIAGIRCIFEIIKIVTDWSKFT